MGGNLVLKLAGERGAAAPRTISRAIVGVSPLMDLAALLCRIARTSESRLYASRFLSEELKRFRRKIELYPGLYTAKGLKSRFEPCGNLTSRSSRDTAASPARMTTTTALPSSNWAQDIAVPTLILHAHLDDPFIRMTLDTRAKLVANPRVMLVETRHGGHCAFLSLEPGDAGYWAGENASGLSCSPQ